VDLDELETLPKVSDMIADCLGRVKGNFPRTAFLNYLAASKSPEAKAFLREYRDVPKRDIESIPIEAICVKADVSPLTIMGALFDAAKDVLRLKSALKAIIAHPQVVESTIRLATDEVPLLVRGQPILNDSGRPILVGHGDLGAQRTIHEAVGFLPTKQGSQIAINLGMGKSKDDDDEGDDEKSWSEAFPTIAGELEGWSENRRKLGDGK
jgi:hypothetical protein